MNSEPITRTDLRLPTELADRLKLSAKQNNRSMNAEIVTAIETYLQRGQKNMTTAQTDLNNEILSHFRTAYVRALTERLTELAQEGELEGRLQNDMIDGDLLTGVDQDAYSLTMQEYGWRAGDDTIRELFQDRGAEVYDGIDYTAIISKARSNF